MASVEEIRTIARRSNTDLTTVKDLIERLSRLPENALVFTNQYGGDFSEIHTVDLGSLQVTANQTITADSDGLVYFTETDDVMELEDQTIVLKSHPVVWLKSHH